MPSSTAGARCLVGGAWWLQPSLAPGCWPRRRVLIPALALLSWRGCGPTPASRCPHWALWTRAVPRANTTAHPAGPPPTHRPAGRASTPVPPPTQRPSRWDRAGARTAPVSVDADQQEVKAGSERAVQAHEVPGAAGAHCPEHQPQGLTPAPGGRHEGPRGARRLSGPAHIGSSGSGTRLGLGPTNCSAPPKPLWGWGGDRTVAPMPMGLRASGRHGGAGCLQECCAGPRARPDWLCP